MRRATQIAVWVVVGVALAAMPRASAQTTQERALTMIEKATGLKPITIPGTEGAYLGKIHRGYQVNLADIADTIK